jgi:hypothetical protein
VPRMPGPLPGDVLWLAPGRFFNTSEEDG